MKKTILITVFSALISNIAFSQTTLRGSFNNWEAEPMLKQSPFGAGDIVTIKDCDVAEFKFDKHGDWSENFGVWDDYIHRDTLGRLIEGQIIGNGNNIKVECNQTYHIDVSLRFKRFFIKAIDAEVPETLEENSMGVLRKALKGGGSHGSVNLSAEFLVQDLPSLGDIVVNFTTSNNETREETATFVKTRDDGLKIFKILIGGYGTIEINSARMETADGSYEIEIDPNLIR